jgi:hypothetical protein
LKLVSDGKLALKSQKNARKWIHGKDNEENDAYELNVSIRSAYTDH